MSQDIDFLEVQDEKRCLSKIPTCGSRPPKFFCCRNDSASAAAMTALLIAFLLTPIKAGWSYSGGLSNAETHHLAALRQAGLTGDQSQINMMRDIIKNPYGTHAHTFAPSVDELLVTTALRSLTRLHVVAAIPDIDSLAVQTKQNYPSLANFAVVQEARLKAEQEAGNNPDPAVQVADFYRILGLTAGEINTGAANYKKQYYASPEGRRLPLPVEVYAMREIADVAYQGQLQDSESLPDVSQIDFSLDYPSALKIRLAPLSEESRVSTLIDSLTTAKVLSRNEDYAMQLLADEGLEASPVIAAQLETMRQHRSQYQQINFSAFFQVLEAIGDAKQSAAIAQFQQDPDVNVKREAETTSHNLSPGSAKFFPRAAGY